MTRQPVGRELLALGLDAGLNGRDRERVCLRTIAMSLPQRLGVHQLRVGELLRVGVGGVWLDERERALRERQRGRRSDSPDDQLLALLVECGAEP